MTAMTRSATFASRALPVSEATGMATLTWAAACLRADRTATSIVAPEPFLFFRDDRRQFRRIGPLGCQVLQEGAVFGHGAERKFAIQGMADFADHKHVERAFDQVRHRRGHHHPAPGQSQHHVGDDSLAPQQSPQLDARFFA